MILTRLKEFWERGSSDLPAGYQMAFLTKRIVLNSEGELLGVETLSGSKKGAREGKYFPVPREQPQRTGAVCPRLVQDNPNYSLGIAGPNDKVDKVNVRHAAYRKLLHQCFADTKEPTIEVILRWLNDGGAKDPRLSGIDPDLDDLLFEVGGIVPTDLPSLRAFWAKPEDGRSGLCLASGLEAQLTDRMPFPIKNVPGGQTSGTMLVSVNNPSGESYGLKAGFNSPIGKESAESICNGLNKLLSEQKHRIRVGESVFLFWTKIDSEFDFWHSFDSPDESQVKAMIDSANKGATPLEVTEADFFALSLSANASRIVVRDFQELTIARAQWAMGKWFSKLQLIAEDGKVHRPLSVYAYAASLYRDANKEMPKHVPIQLMRSAITGQPLPRNLLALAVKRNIAAQGPYEVYKDRRKISAARIALIKAVLLDSMELPEGENLIELNLENKIPAYNCGRLLSVLESIQRVAIPGLNATLVDRHYGSASVSPGVVFGALLRDATTAHLPKLRKNSPGAYISLDRRLLEVLASLGEAFPKTLDYEEQGLFALGYYHQRASDLAAASKHKELRALAQPLTASSDDAEDEKNN
jgi:CRISPR-associated protein Csd1